MSKLQDAYRRHNKHWFRGRLPQCRVRWSKHLRDMAEYDGDQSIKINAAFKDWPGAWNMSLLHEMAHVATRSECIEHGPRFKAEMLRLARAGAFDPYW